MFAYNDHPCTDTGDLSFKAHSHPTVNADRNPFRPVPEVVSSVSGSVTSELTNPESSGRNGAIPTQLEAAV